MILIIYCLLPMAIFGSTLFLVSLMTIVKHRREGIKINFWMLLNALWRLCHSPLSILNDKYSNLIQKDMG